METYKDYRAGLKDEEVLLKLLETVSRLMDVLTSKDAPLDQRNSAATAYMTVCTDLELIQIKKRLAALEETVNS